MRDLKHAAMMVVAALVAIAVIVVVVVTHWLPAVIVVAAAGVLLALMRHGDRLTVAYWPSRQQGRHEAASITGQPPPAPETAERDPWL